MLKTERSCPFAQGCKSLPVCVYAPLDSIGLHGGLQTLVGMDAIVILYI